MTGPPALGPGSSAGSAAGDAEAAASSSGAPAGTASRRREVVVVGGGIGGLVVAGRLAKEGCRVTLLEQNAQVGGRCQSLHRDGFRWDTGPSLLLFPDTYRDTYAKLGTRLEDHVPLQRVEPAAYRVFFGPPSGSSGGGGPPASRPAVPAAADNGNGNGGGASSGSSSSSSRVGEGAGFTYLDLMYDVQQMAQQLEAVEAGAGTEFVSWLAAARRALVVGTDNFIARDVKSFGELLDPSRLLPLLSQVDPFELLGQHHARLSRRFKDPRIPALLSFQDLYVGLSPYNAPGVFSLLAATELTDGVFYPMGGFEKVRDSLLQIAQSLGVEVRTRARVVAILVDPASGRARGVCLAPSPDGGGGGAEEVLQADAVVTNVDVAESLGLLEGAQSAGTGPGTGGPGGGKSGAAEGPAVAHAKRRKARLEAAEYSAGVISFNWAVSSAADLGPLLHHNVFLSGDFEASWRRARTADELLPNPNFYVHVPSRTDPSAAPPGGHSVMVLLPVANAQERGNAAAGCTDDPYDYASLVEAGRAAVLSTLRAAGADLTAPGAIASETVIDPPAWRARFGLSQGAVFGLSHGLLQLSLLRPGPEDPKLPGLYFVGASGRPGNGVPLVMMGADQCVGRVLRGLGLRP